MIHFEFTMDIMNLLFYKKIKTFQYRKIIIITILINKIIIIKIYLILKIIMMILILLKIMVI